MIETNKNLYLKGVRAGLNDLTTRIMGPNSLIQGAVPDILENTTKTYFDSVIDVLSVSLGKYNLLKNQFNNYFISYLD